MKRSVRLVYAIALSVCACVASGAPLTISFVASADTATRGSRVRWTVWAHLPEDAPEGTEIIGMSADFRPTGIFTGVVLDPTALSLNETERPTVEGAEVLGLEIVRDGDASGLPRSVPLYAFVTEFTHVGGELSYDLDLTLLLRGPNGYTFYRRVDGVSAGDDAVEVHSDAVLFRGCGAGDVAPPYGVLDEDDLAQFVRHFSQSLGFADIAPPFGIVDSADLSFYLRLFAAPCRESWD